MNTANWYKLTALLGLCTNIFKSKSFQPYLTSTFKLHQNISHYGLVCLFNLNFQNNKFDFNEEMNHGAAFVRQSW